MRRLFRTLMLIVMSLLLWSCNIRDGHKDCGVYLKFIFDYNMEYADAFDSQIATVDVFLFDSEGKYLFSKHAVCESELIEGKWMYLSDGLGIGTYKLITVGALTEHFRFTDLNDASFTPGLTPIEQVKLALYRESEQVSHEFPHVWFGESTMVNYKGDLSVWPVYLVRNTNKFNIVLESTETAATSRSSEVVPYTFEIITPEGAAYGHENNPLVREPVVYQPYQLTPGNQEINLSAAKLNTMRLLVGNTDDYQLIIRSTETQQEVWSYDLMILLEKTKPSKRPDGSILPFQEYLDRQSEWNIVILHRGGTPGSGEAFVALGIEVNGWIMWLNEIGV